jgi:indolepyruvate ferredoxin oxidoreductase alpha subunit
MVEKGFELSEASQHAGDAGAAHPRLPRHRRVHREEQPRPRSFGLNRIARTPALRLRPLAHPPAPSAGEAQGRGALPAAQAFIARAQAQRVLRRRPEDIGIIVLGRPLQHRAARAARLGLADAFGNARVPIYVLNVAYPLVPEEVRASAPASAPC